MTVVLILVRVAVAVVLVAGPWTDEPAELAGWDVARLQELSESPGRAYADFEVEYPPGTLLVGEVLAGPHAGVTHDRLVALCLAAVLAVFGPPNVDQPVAQALLVVRGCLLLAVARTQPQPDPVASVAAPRAPNDAAPCPQHPRCPASCGRSRAGRRPSEVDGAQQGWELHRPRQAAAGGSGQRAARPGQGQAGHQQSHHHRQSAAHHERDRSARPTAPSRRTRRSAREPTRSARECIRDSPRSEGDGRWTPG